MSPGQMVRAYSEVESAFVQFGDATAGYKTIGLLATPEGRQKSRKGIIDAMDRIETAIVKYRALCEQAGITPRGL